MEIDELQTLWRMQQESLNKQKILNRKLIGRVIKNRSQWLAPKTTGMLIVFAVCACVTIASIVFEKMYWTAPILIMCAFGIYQAMWQQRYRRKIESMEGGLVGMERNLIEYRRRYERSKREMWVILIPYFVWFGWFLHHLGWDMIASAVFLSFTAILCLIVYRFRNKKTYSALDELEESLEELRELEKE